MPRKRRVSGRGNFVLGCVNLYFYHGEDDLFWKLVGDADSLGCSRTFVLFKIVQDFYSSGRSVSSLLSPDDFIEKE